MIPLDLRRAAVEAGLREGPFGDLPNEASFAPLVVRATVAVALSLWGLDLNSLKAGVGADSPTPSFSDTRRSGGDRHLRE